MSILLVEDDDFKAADLKKVVHELLPDVKMSSAISVTSALKALSRETFNLVILDMSLPTFDLSGPGGGGSPQAQGGVEVLRLAKHLKRQASFIVVTQYPDIEIDGREIALESAAKTLSEKFSMPILKCILYEFDSDYWRVQFRTALVNLSDKV